MAGTYKVGKKWRADWFDNDGIRHRKRFDTKREAEDHLVQVGAELKQDVWVDPDKVPTFGEVCNDWLQDRIAQTTVPGTGYRPSTLAQWQSHVAHIKACIGRMTASDVDVTAVQRMIAKLHMAEKAGGRELSPRTVAKVKTTASRIFRFGMAKRKKTGIQVNPITLLEKTKDSSGEQSEDGVRLHVGLHEVTEKEVLTPQEVKEVLLAAEPGFYRTIIATAIYSGARISELLALPWSNIDFEQSVIKIRRTLSTARVKPIEGEDKKATKEERIRWFDPKTKRGKRDIPMTPTLASTLKAWREKCPKSRLDLVFPNEFGEVANRTGIGRHGLTSALRQAKIEKKITMHSLRHTYATLLIYLGRKTEQISEYMGHADIIVTLTVYAHFLKEKKQDTMSDLERLIENG
jgi:integrase